MKSSQKTVSAAEIQLQETSSNANHKQQGQQNVWQILKWHEMPALHNKLISHHGKGHHFNPLLGGMYTNVILLNICN